MAKVDGPLMSMTATGTYGKSLTYSRRKGVNVVRQRVTPANPQTEGQMIARNRMSTGGVIQRFINNTALTQPGETSTDKALLAAGAPSNSTWNAYLVQAITGGNGVTYSAAQVAWAALTAPQKAAWDAAAAALTPAMTAAPQRAEGGASTTELSAGNVFWIYQYGLASVGLAPTPGAVPPVYA